MRPAETVDSLPVIAHGKQRRVFILRPQRRKQRSALRRDILKLIHQNVFPRADEAPFLQNDNGLMDQPRKIDRVFVFQRGFPRFQHRRHQLNPLRKHGADRLRCAFYHLRLRAAVHAHQAYPPVETRAQPARQLFILPEAALRHLPAEFLFKPLTPAFRLRLFFTALLTPCLDKQRLASLSVVLQLADNRNFFAALLNDV